MNFKETCSYLFEKLASYQVLGSSALNKSLDKTLNLAQLLGFPEKKFKSIHIAGTNGKGSSSTLLASIFQEAGYKVGLYTSPHLKSFTERIKINGKEIDEQFVIDFVKQIKPFIETQNPSFFEITTLMAFDYFAQNSVDIAIIETGLGGRLDSKNILQPELSLITNIGLDHQNILGNTIEEIAYEKAGIIKNYTPIVLSETQESTHNLFKKVAQLKNAPIFFADETIQLKNVQIVNNKRIFELNNTLYQLDLLGNYQLKNIKGVLKSIEILQKTFSILPEHIKNGLNNSIQNTKLKGRWQILQQNPTIICDTGHNEDGIKAIIEQLKSEKYNHLYIILGMVSDKDYKKILPLLPLNASYIFCKPNIERALEPNILFNYGTQIGLNAEIIENVNEAIAQTQKKCSFNDLIFVGGSTFVVAEIENL